ncbi:SRPBCC family protein [Nocardia noduli]|uniref:SRPBCC family protein n=1 Tax=Nocardia noduli TaxID=2815722 RepID=UPI001C219943|nr:SRPBCC family protein [Nocardia noduli]
METITVERVIDAPIDRVFEWLSVASNYTRAPIVLRERLVRPGTDAPYGEGAVRVLTWVIGRFRERITAYRPPHEFEYLVERSFPPSRHEGGKLTFTEVDGGTSVVWTTVAEVRLPFGAGVVTRIVVKPVISYVFRRVLTAADRDLRT